MQLEKNTFALQTLRLNNIHLQRGVHLHRQTRTHTELKRIRRDNMRRGINGI